VPPFVFVAPRDHVHSTCPRKGSRLIMTSRSRENSRTMIERYIEFFKKNSDEFVSAIPLNIDIAILQKKFNLDEYDPLLYYVYPIQPEDEGFFLPFADGYRFNFDNFDYFLVCSER